MKNLQAVITGDVKNSSIDFKNQQKQLLEGLNDVYQYIQQYFPDSLPFEIDIFRGDSFQFLISDITKSVAIMVVFWLYAKSRGIELKLSLGIGSVEYLNETKISESNGEAFILSGTGLEKLSKKSIVNISIPAERDDTFIKAYLELLDIYLLGLSEKNALAIFGKIVGLKQESIVKMWNDEISQQSISKHWKNLHADKILNALHLFSAYLNKYLNNTTL